MVFEEYSSDSEIEANASEYKNKLFYHLKDIGIDDSESE